MSSNPYEAEASVGRDHFEDVDNFRLTQATLALAYEQRTANLVALYAFTEGNSEALNYDTGLTQESWATIAKQIIERLDLA